MLSLPYSMGRPGPGLLLAYLGQQQLGWAAHGARGPPQANQVPRQEGEEPSFQQEAQRSPGLRGSMQTRGGTE